MILTWFVAPFFFGSTVLQLVSNRALPLNMGSLSVSKHHLTACGLYTLFVTVGEFR